MNVIRCHDKLEVAVQAYAIFKHQLNTKLNSILGLATGSSPVNLYKVLIEGFKKGEVSFKEVISFNLDEYVGMDVSHPQSYAYFMKEHLFDHVDINQSNTNLPNGLAPDLQAECDRYNHALSSHVVDLQLLGIGTNGHIAFNEPYTPFDSVTSVVELNESTRRDNAVFFNSIDEVPTHALSMGIQNILNAKKIVLIATGAAKAEAVYNIINGPVDVSCPGSILQTHPDVTIIIDQDAASKL